MPALPDGSPPELSPRDRLVILLASAAQPGGRLSAEAWKRASDALEAVFGPASAKDASLAASEADEEKRREFFLLRTRFHAALLRDPLPPAQFSAGQELAGDLAALPPERAEAYVQALRELAPEYAEILELPLPEAAGRKSRLGETWKKGVDSLPGVGAWKELFGEEDAADTRGVIMENGAAVPRKKRRDILPPVWKRQVEHLSSFLSETGKRWGGVAEDVAHSAASRYQGAARCLSDLQRQRLFSLMRRRPSAAALRFRAADTAAESLKQAALESGAWQTAANVQELRCLMEEQPFTVVLVGEGKRGKSSLVNALLGKALSPVRESAPETAAVARFRWGTSFSGTVSFLGEDECEHLQACLEAEKSSPESALKLQRMARARPPGGTLELRSEDRIRAFLSAEEEDSLFAASVDVVLPAPLLEKGLVLVDTPGLNATDPVQNYLSFEECLSADCLVFVVDARRPESLSEQELLHQLAESGRAASVIGVVTGVDRLNEKDSRQEAMQRAGMLMDVAAASGMKVLGLLAINAREAMEQRCGNPRRSGGAAFRQLCSLIERAAADKNLSAERVERLREKGLALVQAAKRDAEAMLVREGAQLPDPRHIELLRSHADRLEGVLHSCSEQVWAIVNSAAIDMDAWRREQERALDAWQERTVQRVMDAAGRHADALGFSGMFRARNWKTFDETDVPRIARQCLEELLAERREVQNDWNEKLHQFGQRLEELSLLCLDAVTAGQSELQGISDVPFSQERWFFHANSVMKKLGLVAAAVMIRRGAGLGVGIVLGNMGWWALLPAAVAGSVVWTLMRLGSPTRCRRIFLERKEAAVKSWTRAQRTRLDEVLGENLEELTSAYSRAVNAGFLPAMSVLGEETAALRTYLGVLQKIRDGAQNEAERLVLKSGELETALQSLGNA